MMGPDGMIETRPVTRVTGLDLTALMARVPPGFDRNRLLNLARKMEAGVQDAAFGAGIDADGKKEPDIFDPWNDDVKEEVNAPES